MSFEQFEILKFSLFHLKHDRLLILDSTDQDLSQGRASDRYS